MKVELIIPIDKLRGMLRKDGFYFRMYLRDQRKIQSDREVYLYLFSGKCGYQQRFDIHQRKHRIYDAYDRKRVLGGLSDAVALGIRE